jgi:hypothetical protein
MMRDSSPKYQMNLAVDESKMKPDLTTKCKLPEVMEIEIFDTFENAEPSMT